ncbi:hypothetical protein TRFO_23999 [Tritrichomonas foetus]|uniref:Protein kinase domain-containing protein n=1 Tax=Tritrichomonas foetus TaxID=1144522 RepID=A0A1J4KDD1_9EUKA|nr:hypothetical protein TRFO_23999 [Tritrichomonas foetus]|eukprot:OHT07724.1 hypothetical protein TRFO_23999 [Tritrichomonas foetus]
MNEGDDEKHYLTQLDAIFPPNIYQNIVFFWNYKMRSLFLYDIDPKFVDYLYDVTFTPCVVINFFSDNFETYFCLCCENLLLIVYYNDLDFFQNLIPRLKDSMIVPCNENDIKILSQISPDLKYFSNNIQNIFKDVQIALDFHLNYSTIKYDDNMTYSRFLFLSLFPVMTHFLFRQRFRLFPCEIPESFIEYDSDDFIFLREIGQGSYGVVSLQIHKKTGILVAIKSFNKQKKKILRREKEIYKLLKHPSIVRCYGFIKSLYSSLVFEYIAKGDLRQAINEKSLTNTHKSKIILQILFGIDYMHAKGIMHRDIKCDNILLNDNYDAFITDFDLARQYLTDQKTTLEIGSFCYRSPEQMNGDDVSFQTDLYSFGLLIYEVATGNLPFNGLSISQMIDRITSGDIPKLSHKFGKISKIYDMCTSLNIERRSSSFYIIRLMIDEGDFFTGTKKSVIKNLIKQYEIINVDRKDVQFIIDKANMNHSLSQLYLGVIYMDGIAVAKNEKEGFKWFYAAANQGVVEAMYNVAVCLSLGKGTNKNDLLSFYWLKKAAKSGLLYALHDLAAYYEIGKGTEKNLEKAFKYYKKAADKKLPISQLKVSQMLDNGKGTHLDPNQSLVFLRQSAKQGNASAEYHLANFFLLNKDYHKALKWYLKASKYFPRSFLKTGIIYFSFFHDYEKALIELFKARKAGETLSYLYIALIYKAIGNIQESEEFMKVAAKRGISSAQYYYGEILIEKDDEKGREYLEKAAAAHISMAQYKLGYLYEHGKFLKQDINKATELYKTTASVYCTPAVEKLAKLQPGLKISKKFDRCSFEKNGKHYITQMKYECLTCGIIDDLCFCSFCAEHCHKDHLIVDNGSLTIMYCDCGCKNHHFCTS